LNVNTADFETFLIERTKAAEAYVRGDGHHLEALLLHDGDATFFSPLGDVVQGAGAVAERYLRDSKAFRQNGVTRLEVLHKGVGDGCAYWTGFQLATVQVGDMPQPREIKMRVTEIFRKVDGAWKLVHRHADLVRG
jgi:ketosteroid isomerase-like protein